MFVKGKMLHPLKKILYVNQLSKPFLFNPKNVTMQGDIKKKVVKHVRKNQKLKQCL